MVPIHRTPARPVAASRPSLDKSLPPMPPDSASESSSESTSMTMTTVLIGPKQKPFKVHRKRLCAVSPFFRAQLEMPSQPHSHSHSHSQPLSHSRDHSHGQSHSRDQSRSHSHSHSHVHSNSNSQSRRHSHQSSKQISLWLPGESATMFGLFVEWVHSPTSFRSFLDIALATADTTSPRAFQELHWGIIRLHLFASHLFLYRLQDLAMDAVQDLYLRRDWDVPAGLVIFLYTKCEAIPAVRLRRWTVAMVAFAMTASSHMQVKFHPQDDSVSDPSRFRALLDSLPEFAEDYAMHLRKMHASRLEIRFKNPQLRIAANKLRNDQRLFGFRECSFHSHRATVGEKPCPHGVGRRRDTRDVNFGATMSKNKRDQEEKRNAVPPPLFAKEGEWMKEKEKETLMEGVYH